MAYGTAWEMQVIDWTIPYSFFLYPLFLWFWNSDCGTEKTAHTYYRN